MLATNNNHVQQQTNFFFFAKCISSVPYLPNSHPLKSVYIGADVSETCNFLKLGSCRGIIDQDNRLMSSSNLISVVNINYKYKKFIIWMQTMLIMVLNINILKLGLYVLTVYSISSFVSKFAS